MEAIIQSASTPVEPSIVDSAPELKPDVKEVLVDKATELKDVKEGKIQHTANSGWFKYILFKLVVA